MLEIEYEFREKDLLHYNELQMKNNEAFKKNINKNRLIYPGLMTIIGLFYWSYYSQVDTALYILAVAVLWAIIVPWALNWEFKQKLIGSYTKQEKADMFGKYHLIIEPGELIEKSPSGKHKMKWSELLRVDYSRSYVYIVIDIGTALVIPRETVNKGDLDQFRTQTAKMIDRYG